MEKRIFLPMTFWFSLPWIAYTYENIALHKLAKQKHPFLHKDFSYLIFHDFSASNAVDGLKTDCSAYGGQCTLSAVNKRVALWYVDLGSILSIHHITIYYRTDNVTWGPSNGFVHRFLGFSVYISNTTEGKDFVLCFKDTTFNDTTIPAVLTLNCTTQGRYVAYYNNRTATNLPSFYSEYAFSELCEFEVYGCSNPGYYSENCSMPCPPHCVNSRCHLETGHCFECEDGYQGPKCEQLCQNNTFGGSCSENCGHCLSGLQCHHVTGSCYLGCAPGYYGSQCKTACPSGNNRSNGNCIQEDSSEENEEIGSNNQTGNMIIYVAIGGSVGVVTVVITVTVIVYKLRRSGKKDHLSNTQASEKQPNNEDVSLQYDDNIQDSKCHGESSFQMSEYYCELPETGYNDTAAENIYVENVSSQYDDNIQSPKGHGESSSQKSEYYCELVETEYNGTVTERAYEKI
ncbi:uncharacterized protein [Magallana gigas]|uniref:uncharacterized protein n=1 Tax=Magallana gigas TaxID=29159 RepID=UPI00333FC0E5